MKLIHPHALFRLSVLGPLASRDRLEQGDLKALLRELAARSYAIPDTKRVYLSEKTIEGLCGQPHNPSNVACRDMKAS